MTGNPYRVNVLVAGRCKVDLRGERMEEVKEFMYLETELCKHEEVDGEIRD